MEVTIEVVITVRDYGQSLSSALDILFAGAPSEPPLVA